MDLLVAVLALAISTRPQRNCLIELSTHDVQRITGTVHDAGDFSSGLRGDDDPNHPVALKRQDSIMKQAMILLD